MKRILLFVAFVGLTVATAGFAQQDRSEEVRKLKAGIESPSLAQRVNAAKIISRSGIQDQELYARIAAIIKDGYVREPEKNHTEEMSWMCKALAASGDPQYRELLEEVAKNAQSSKLRSYAEQSAELIDEYAQRSQIINATDYWDMELSQEENRLVNMLKSDNLRLQKDAAKTVVRKVGVHNKVFDVISESLQKMFNDFNTESEYVDTMAWMCNALAVSGDVKYIEILDRIIDNSEDSKLKRYASKARNALK